MGVRDGANPSGGLSSAPAGLLVSGRTGGFRLVVRPTLPGSARRVVGGRRQRGGRQERAAVTDRRRAAARVSGTPLIK